jgi:uncharacterized membrane protein YeaQ/YmgE (transglycosylase-associated protein family)
VSIVAWILLGIVAGVVANQLSGRRGDGLSADAVVGIAGAAVAGFAFNTLTGRTDGFSLASLCSSLLGAGVLLALTRAWLGPSKVPAPTRAPRNPRVRR